MSYTKNYILSTLDILEKNNDDIKNSIKIQDNIIDILTNCQNRAIEIGTYIETLGEYTSNIVKKLEDYCESIYQLSVNINNENARYELTKKIEYKLKELKIDFDKILKNGKKQIVFLPYKASMWDSLESIYLEAVKDERFDVYVIPIPYYDKNNNGILGELHNESSLYPSNIKITKIEDYDISMEKPDIIFIHNPYDDGNHVTSVEPFFYSKNLKKYTKKLVYVPYFLSVNRYIRPELCITKGAIYSDKIIVDCENVKKIYIQEFRKLEKELNIEGNFGDLDKKIVSIGSPKSDKMRNTKIEDIEIPQEWKKLFFDKNNKKKKIILYNVTIEAFLRDSDKSIKKIKNVLQFFEKKENILLLWRPHPLLEQTIKSMRPNFYKEYILLVQEYIKKGYGIFDDTPDINRAILLSDAYYGDMSSVVGLYEVIEKPICIQNIYKI